MENNTLLSDITLFNNYFEEIKTYLDGINANTDDALKAHDIFTRSYIRPGCLCNADQTQLLRLRSLIITAVCTAHISVLEGFRNELEQIKNQFHTKVILKAIPEFHNQIAIPVENVIEDAHEQKDILLQDNITRADQIISKLKHRHRNTRRLTGLLSHHKHDLNLFQEEFDKEQALMINQEKKETLNYRIKIWGLVGGLASALFAGIALIFNPQDVNKEQEERELLSDYKTATALDSNSYGEPNIQDDTAWTAIHNQKKKKTRKSK